MDIAVNSEPSQNQTPKDTPTDTPVEDTVTAAPPPSKSAGSGKKKGLIIALVLLLLAVAGLAAYFLMHSDTKKTPSQTAVVKKDIPLINFGYQTYGTDNVLYPAATNYDPNYDVNMQIFEGLVQFKNISQIQPLLATSWTNPDDSTWDFQLAKNIKFHSGRTMTAADVKFSLESIKDTPMGKLYGTTIKSVQVINDNEVKIVTNGPDPLLLNRLVYLYIMDSKSQLKNSALNGTGPFTLKPGTKPDEKEIDLVAFDDWHGGRPNVRAINFKVYTTEAEQVAAAEKGDINVLFDLFETPNQEKLAKMPAFKHIEAANIGVTALRLNTLKPKSPLADKRVREALYDSLDTQALFKARNLGGVLANQIVPQIVPGYNPKIPTHQRDVAKAKSLLKDAGYANGLTLQLATFEASGSTLPEEVVKEAKEAGITVKSKTYTDGDAEFADIESGKTNFFSYTLSTSIFDLTDVVTDTFQGQDYSNATVDFFVVQANKTLDSAKRLELLQQISKILMDDVALIPVYSRTQHFYTDPSFVITRDRAGGLFGVNFGNVYATK